MVVFRLERQRYALPIIAVDRIVQAVEVTALPGAPRVILGAINVQGVLIPVIDLRRRLGLPEREIGLADHFLIAKSAGRPVALVIDEAEGLAELPEEVIEAGVLAPGLERFEGVVALDGDVVLIHDPDRFLSLHEVRVLDEAVLSDM